MKQSTKIGLLTVILGVVALSWAHASPYSYTPSNRGWYISGAFGLGIPSDPDYSIAGGQAEVDTDLGFAGAFAVGYDWNHLRFELEYSYRQNDGKLNGATGVGLANGQQADFEFHSLMFNMLYDFYLTDSVYWYNGVGLGISFVDLSTTGGSADEAVFAWQLMTGVGFDITHNVALTLGYRLFTTRDLNVSIANADTPFINALELGIRYNF